MLIRRATVADREDIRNIHLCAFAEEEGDNGAQLIAELAINLLLVEKDAFSLVAEVDNNVAGHVAFSPIVIDNNNSNRKNESRGSILAPLAVHPDYQKRGIGSGLVEAGKEQLINMGGVHILFVYGDPKYYSRFGFTTTAATNYIPPFKLRWPRGWQATLLSTTASSNDGTGTEPLSSASSSACKTYCVKSLCKPELW